MFDWVGLRMSPNKLNSTHLSWGIPKYIGNVGGVEKYFFGWRHPTNTFQASPAYVTKYIFIIKYKYKYLFI